MKDTYTNAEKLAKKCEEKLDFSTKLNNEFYYSSLVFCVIDAVFSMGTHYSGAEKAVKNYAEKYNLSRYNTENPQTEHRISDFIHNCDTMGDFELLAETVFRNRQRTSSTNGMLKAEACYDVAKVLKEHNIETFTDFRNMSAETEKKVVAEIKQVKGQGSGIMIDYLFMLAGDENKFKPDRHLLSFISDTLEDNNEISELFKSAHQILKDKHPDLTIRHLDYLIWNYQRKAKKQNKTFCDNGCC